MTDQSEPCWKFLPHAPERFFGLSADFDLRDLKRSYNRLIRRFKPEKFPDEFQRIRRAYESLNDALRYHLPTRPPADPPVPADDKPQTRHETPPAPPGKAVDVEPAAPPPEPLQRRAASTPALDLYNELRPRPLKTPGDYVALAVLSDVVAEADSARTDGESFSDWLLAGLADHPHDAGLTELLRQYLCEEHTATDVAGLLQRVVKVLPVDRFQYTTERAWDRLLREAPFEQFRDCLQRCGARLGKSVGHSQLVFYLHVLKLALWKADDDFLNEIRETVEDHFHALESWAQEEYETIAALIDYRDRRDAFVALGPCCERIDRAIRDWCVLSETDGDRSVLDCQYFLSMRGRRLFDELPDFKEDFSHVLLPWDRIVADVLDRLGEPASRQAPALAMHTRDFMIRILRRFKRTSRYYLGLALLLAAFAMMLVTLVASGALAVRLCWALFAEGRYLGAFLYGLSAAAVLLGGLVASVAAFLIGRRNATLRYEAARRELVKLIRVAPLPVDQLANIIAEREDEKYDDDETIDDTHVIAGRMVSDAAIEFFAQAQLCLSAADPEPVVEAVLAEPEVKRPKAPTRPLPRRIR